MGISGISIWQLLIILMIVVVLFGTKRLRDIGTDLGNAIKGFRGAMRDGEQAAEAENKSLEGPTGDKKPTGEVPTQNKDRI
jgi:sec-independent protein translocase protein TatA